jgi:hypothetical protein
LVKPVTLIGEETAVATTPPGVDNAEYAEIAEPPTLAGAVNATDAVVSPPVAVPMVGALGFLNGSKKAEIKPAGGRSGMMPPYQVIASYETVNVNLLAVPLVAHNVLG